MSLHAAAGVSRLYDYRSAKEDQALRPGYPAIRRSALLETVVFLLLALALDQLIGGGHRYAGVTPHPFWIIVLLVTVQYGMEEALVTALLASLALLVGNLPEQSLTETMYQYTLRIMFLPFLWTVTALVLGSVRGRQLQERQAMLERMKKAEAAADAIVKGYNAVKQAKEQLELRLAGERCSILTAYKIAKSLETTDPAEAQKAALELVRVSLNPAKFSLYGWEDGMLRLEVSYGWEAIEPYQRRFATASPLLRHILGKERMVSVASEEGEAIMDGQGVLAGLIRDERTGKVFGMLKIEEIGFVDLGAHSHETFRIVCEWIAHMYANVESHRSSAAKPSPLRLPGSLFKQATYAKTASRVAA